MKKGHNLIRLSVFICVVATFVVTVSAQDGPFKLSPRAACTTPPLLHCPDSECSQAILINPGPVVELKTRRTYFLDYPCDLKKGEKVTFVLSLHGGGLYANWHRHYFPMMDYVDKYRLVIATPSSPTGTWSAADDEYLQNIVTWVMQQLGKENLNAFWLVGHSFGATTCYRLVRTDFFKDKVDGWLSLSGGRLGGNPGFSAAFFPTAPSAAAKASMAAADADLRDLPPVDFSHIFATGQREIDDNGVSETSEWARKYSCGPRRVGAEVVDTRAGYVYDNLRLNLLRSGWGLLPAPGKAQVYTYPDCKDGKVVADVIRNDKGHTEGLEPKVTEELIRLMLSAKGGKIQQSSINTTKEKLND